MKLSRMLIVGVTGLVLAIVIKKVLNEMEDYRDHDDHYLYDTDFLSSSKFDYEKMLAPVRSRGHLKIHADEDDDLFI